MHPQEAHHFITLFATEIADPEAHRRFLNWLRDATLSEFNEIADRYELIFNWSLTPSPPSVEWITKLESRLDKAIEGQHQTIYSRA